MQLPGVDGAVIEPAKLRDYVLSPTHAIGRFKARFFFALGYTQDDWPALERELRRHAEHGEATGGESSVHGQKFAVRGRLSGPAGREAEVVAIWIIRTAEDFPRFVTAFPG